MKSHNDIIYFSESSPLSQKIFLESLNIRILRETVIRKITIAVFHRKASLKTQLHLSNVYLLNDRRCAIDIFPKLISIHSSMFFSCLLIIITSSSSQSDVQFSTIIIIRYSANRLHIRWRFSFHSFLIFTREREEI